MWNERLCVVEGENLRLYSMKNLTANDDIQPIYTFKTGTRYFERLRISFAANNCFLTSSGSKCLTFFNLSLTSTETFVVSEHWRIKKLDLCPEKTMKHLLILVVTVDERDTGLVFFDHVKHEQIARYDGPEFDGAFNPLITFHTTGVFVEVDVAVENDFRCNMWLFFNYKGEKLGSYIYEAKFGIPNSSNGTKLNFSHGRIMIVINA